MNDNVEGAVKRRRSSASRRVEDAIRRQTMTGLSFLSSFIHPLGLASGRKERPQSAFYETPVAPVASLRYADAMACAEALEHSVDFPCETSSLVFFDCSPETIHEEEVEAAADQPLPLPTGSGHRCQYLIIHSSFR